MMAGELRRLTDRLGMPLWICSFDKANVHQRFQRRGLGHSSGHAILAAVKEAHRPATWC